MGKTEYQVLNVLDAQVLFRDIGKNCGEVLVKGRYTSSYTWGAMGSNIVKFLRTINSDYFAGKLSRECTVFDPIMSVRSIRKCIREEFKWYDSIDVQKEIRVRLKEIEASAESEYQFVDMVNSLRSDVLSDTGKNDDFGSSFYEVLSEPWNFIETKPSDEYVYFVNVHEKFKLQFK